LKKKIMAVRPDTRERAIQHCNQRPVHIGAGMISAGEPLVDLRAAAGDR